MADDNSPSTRRTLKVSPETHDLVTGLAKRFGLSADESIILACLYFQDHYAPIGSPTYSLETPHLIRQVISLNQTLEILSIQNSEIVTLTKVLEEGSLKAIVAGAQHMKAQLGQVEVLS